MNNITSEVEVDIKRLKKLLFKLNKKRLMEKNNNNTIKELKPFNELVFRLNQKRLMEQIYTKERLLNIQSRRNILCKQIEVKLGISLKR